MLNSDIKITDPEKFIPFEAIGLAFSGGGFRAASFSLGTISYLQQLRWEENGKTHNLLEHVTYMSSASGGTIATSLYALHSTRNDTTQDNYFLPYYKKLLENINGVTLLDKVFVILNSRSYWEQRQHKRRNIINAFALAYDEMLFERSTAGALDHNGKTNLEEVCFNATEFYRGLLFRQAFKLKNVAPAEKGFVYGNFIINLKPGTAGELKLADLLAASSCFPAGFEPIIFPDDFVAGKDGMRNLLNGLHVEAQELSHEELNLLYKKTDVDEVIKKVRETSGGNAIDLKTAQEALHKLQVNDSLKFGLMDGGITDNQGFESMLRANERREDAAKKQPPVDGFRPFDLLLINDVGSHYMDPYQLPKQKRKGWFTINRLLGIAIVALLVGIAGLICMFGCPAHPLFVKLSGVFGGLFTVAGGGILFGIYKLRRFIKGNVNDSTSLNLDNNFSPEITNRFFHYFGSTPLSILLRMMKERGTSVLTLNNDIFLKRIRQLIYKTGFDNPKLKHRLKANHIYDLTFTNDINRLGNRVAANNPSQAMQLVAQSAFEMGTTLWFDSAQRENFKLADIVACGQFTTCFNLLEYIDRLEKAEGYNLLPQNKRDRVTAMREQVLKDLDKFKTDPYWMYNALGKASGMANFHPVKLNSMELPADFKGLR
jgi:hypothetical protein